MAREARVQAQEVGVINMTRFSQGDTGWGVLVVIWSNNVKTLVIFQNLVIQYCGWYVTPGRHKATLVLA